MKRIIASVLIIISSTAFADTVNDFREMAGVLPQALLAKGYSRIGNLELNPFLSRVSGMNVTESNAIKHRQSLGGGIEMERNLAEWRRTAVGDVAVSHSRWTLTPPEARPLVALHESLGALGYSDDVFTCSGALYILANDEARATLQAGELAQIEKIARGACVVAGGTTGVTGGGDDFLARARISMIKRGLAEIREGKDRGQALENMESSLFVDLERKRDFKREGSIFDSNYKNTKQCLDSARGRADESTIKVAYQGQPIPHDARNGWTFDPSTNCIYFHGAAVHGWAGYSVLWSRLR